MSNPTDNEIETQRIAGDLTLRLKHGTEEEKQSILRMTEFFHGAEERERLEQWIADGMPES